MVEVPVIGIDHFTAGQGAAKYAHEKAMLAGPIPVRMLPQTLTISAEYAAVDRGVLLDTVLLDTTVNFIELGVWRG